MTKMIRLAGWVVCAGSLLAAAERPASRVAAPGDGNRRGPVVRPLAARPPKVTAQEWEDIQKWMQTYSPNRLKFMMRMEARNGSRFPEAKQLAAVRYRQITRLAAYPKLQKALLEETTAQDQIFGATLDLKNSSDSSAESEADQMLKQGVKKLFEAQLDEKQARIEKLTKEVKDQKENESKLVHDWYKRVHDRAVNQKPNQTRPPPQAAPDDSNADESE